MELSETDVYSTLTGDKTFRLLAILPDSSRKPLKCSLHHCNHLDWASQYETISYCWGDQSVRSTIVVNDYEVSVPASSAAALKRLRLPGSIRMVWIDAVCINQGDLPERGQQVQFMRQIYASGLRNLIYLGEADIRVAVESIAKLHQDITNDFWRLWMRKARPSKSMIRGSFDLAAIQGLLSNEWFWRVWTFQEVLLARENICVCNNYRLNLLSILSTAVFLEEHWNFLPKNQGTPELQQALGSASNLFNALNSANSSRVSQKVNSDMVSDLLSSLDNTSHRQSSLPVDKIYGLLALNLGLKMTPDYTKTPLEVCIEAAQCIIKDQSRLWILRDVESYRDAAEPKANSSAETSTPLPSWVPEWTATQRDPYRIKKLFTFFDACAGSPFDTSLLDPTSTTLVAQGIAIDTVSASTEMLCSDQDFANTLLQVQTLSTAAAARSGTSKAEPATSSPPADSNSDPDSDRAALHTAHTLVCGRDYQYGRTNDRQVLPIYRYLCSLVSSNIVSYADIWDHSDPDQEGYVKESVREYWRSLRLMAKKRRFFVTEGGRVGLGPEAMQVGDRVVLLWGLKWPAVLRVKEAGVEGGAGGQEVVEYTFVGVAYVHVVMDGEAVREHKKAGGRDEMFRIV